MSTLFLDLPSFATDYSGFISAVYDMGGMVVLHDPSGCIGNYTNCDEPRWYKSPVPVFTSRLRELEAVSGDAGPLTEKIVATAGSLDLRFICVLSTPVPSLIGVDIEEVAFRVGERTGIPSFGISTTGLRFYNDGIKKALAWLYDSFTDKAALTLPKTVNVLGMTPLDYFTGGEDIRLRRQIESCGYSAGALFGMGGDLEKIKSAASAEKNIVMSMAALPLAKRMEEEHEIPYWIGPPAGETGRAALRRFLCGGADESSYAPSPDSNGILIVAEQAVGNAIRRSLIGDGGYAGATVATLFEFDGGEAWPGDSQLKDEGQLRALLQKGWRTVIGDPLFARMCPPRARYIPMPHPAVSSKTRWKNYIPLID